MFIFVGFGTRGDVQPVAVLAEHMRRQVCCDQTTPLSMEEHSPLLITHASHASWLTKPPFDGLSTRFVDSSPWDARQDKEAQQHQTWTHVKELAHWKPDARRIPDNGISAQGRSGKDQILHESGGEAPSLWHGPAGCNAPDNHPDSSRTVKKRARSTTPSQDASTDASAHHDAEGRRGLIDSVNEPGQADSSLRLETADDVGDQVPVDPCMGQGSSRNESPECPQSHRNIQCLVFNLFALEGFHIAECLDVPCVAVAPYPIPYACPSSFKSRFAAAFPQLYESLTEAGDKDLHKGQMTYQEVRHWMWPLFMEQWSNFRAGLGLSPCPLHDRISGLPMTPLPSAVPLLYGYSPLISPRPGYWPPSVHLCSFWLPPSEWLQQAQLQEPLKTFVCGRKGNQTTKSTHLASKPSEAIQSQGRCGQARLVCVDFASMGSLNLIPYPQQSLCILAGVLLHLDCRAVLLMSGSPSIQTAHEQLLAQSPGYRKVALPRMLVYPQPVPHQLLLPHVSLLMHPGGSGTCASALVAGVPQVVAPIHYDQPFWAERLAYHGLSPPPVPESLFWKCVPTPVGQCNSATAASSGSFEDPNSPIASSSVILQRGSGTFSPANQSSAKQQRQISSIPLISVRAQDVEVLQHRAADGGIQKDGEDGEESGRSAGGLPDDEDDIYLDPGLLASSTRLSVLWRSAFSPEIISRCHGMALELREEDGLQAAVQIMVRHLDHEASDKISP